MTEPAFERAFAEWCEREAVDWSRLRYPRPAAGGETLAHRLRPCGPPRGAVLAVHGAGNDALFALTGLFQELLRRGFEVLSFDVDGHGRQSTTRFAPHTAAHSIPTALAQWGIVGRGLPIHAVGVSLGGSLLLHSLPALSTTLASAALLCAPLQIRLSWRGVARELGPPVLRTLWRERARYGLTGLIPSFGPFKRGLYPLRLAEPPGPGAFGYVEVLNRALSALRLRDAARRVRLPVLLVYGARDLLVPAEQACALHQLLPDSELLLLPRETHLSTPLAPAALSRLFGWIEAHSTSPTAAP